MPIIAPSLPSQEAFIAYLSLTPIGIGLLTMGRFSRDKFVFIKYLFKSILTLSREPSMAQGAGSKEEGVTLR